MEFYTFMAGVKIAMASKSGSAEIGYFFFTFLVEMETRPALVPLLKSVARDYFHYMSHRNNPNGLWAWIAGKGAIVTEQLCRFELVQGDYDWDHYAWDKEYTDWTTGNIASDADKKRSSRVDYLVLQGLAEKGAPKSSQLVLNMKVLLDAIKDAIKSLIEAAIKQYVTSGKGWFMFTDSAGAVVQYMIEKSAGFVQNIWRAGQQTSSMVHRASGIVEQWRWDVAGYGYSKWAGAASVNEIPRAQDLLELRVRDVDGVLRVWKWGQNKAVTEFLKYSKSLVSGAVDPIDILVQQSRAVDGYLHQWVKVEGVLQSYIGWAMSSPEGRAVARDCRMQSLRDAAGQVQQWVYEGDRALKTYDHWASTDVNGNSMSNLLQVSVSSISTYGCRFIC
jgi:hypothetical protein